MAAQAQADAAGATGAADATDAPATPDRMAGRMAGRAPAGPVRLAGHGLRKSFGSVIVADGVSLEVRGGEALGIIGPNGAGKTTLFHLLAGSLPADAGRVELDGADVSREPPHRRCRRGLARTQQIPRPFGDLSVYENALVGAHFGRGHAAPHAADRAMHALDRAGLAALADRPASTLGLLARKRLELARALAADPVVLLLDEVAGGLTEAETGELCGVLDAIRAAGVALVWVEHGVTSLAGFVDRLLALDRGRVVAVGRPDEVLADPEVQRTYLGDDAARLAEAETEADADPPGEVPS
jgi:branched-chain amino acid transport system ATP-binding protein